MHNRHRMQRLFHKPVGDVVQEFDIDHLDVAVRNGGWIWLDLTDPTADDIQSIGHRFGFDPLSIQDVLEITLLPKVDDHGSYLFVVLHGIGSDETGRLTTDEIDFFIRPDLLITAHRAPMAAVDWVAERVADSEQLAAGGPQSIAAAIAEASSRRYLPLLDALDQRIEDLEESAIEGDPRILGASQALRRDVILLRRTLGPQREAVRVLSESLSPLLSDETKRSYAGVYDHYFRLVESLDAARGLLAGVMETYRGAVAERTNEVMKVLTVFSAVLLPLGLIAGLWGMNFADVPGTGWRWGFVGLLGVMTVIAIGLWGYFARRGFVGGPKLRDLPKAVGLGLVQVGTAPLRAVSGLRPRAGDNERTRRDD